MCICAGVTRATCRQASTTTSTVLPPPLAETPHRRVLDPPYLSACMPVTFPRRIVSRCRHLPNQNHHRIPLLYGTLLTASALVLRPRRTCLALLPATGVETKEYVGAIIEMAARYPHLRRVFLATNAGPSVIGQV